MSIIGRLFDKTFAGLDRAMDLTWRRNEAIISNIANAETPRYRAVDLNFAGELGRAFEAAKPEMALTNPGHLDLSSNSEAHFIPDLSGATKADGNNVDIDIQMGQLASNSGEYSQAAELTRRRLRMLSYAIREGAR